MSEYDSLKVISRPPFYRWTGLPDIFPCACPSLMSVFHFRLVDGRDFHHQRRDFAILLVILTALSSKKNGYFIPTLTIRNQQGLPSSYVLLFIHATP